MTRQSKHMKRIAVPKTWPISKKESKYVMKPRAGKNLELCLPSCIIFRDILNLVKTKEEFKRIVNDKEVYVNNKLIKELNHPVGFFDVISVPRIKKHYRLEISANKKITALEIEEKDSYKKPYKVIGKTILKGGKIQLNLYEGANFIIGKEQKIKVNDTILVDMKQNKMIKHIPLQKGSFAWIIKGKHIGKNGEIIDADNDFVTIKTENKNIKTTIGNIYITG